MRIVTFNHLDNLEYPLAGTDIVDVGSYPATRTLPRITIQMFPWALPDLN